MMRDHRFWKICDRKPCKISCKTWFQYFRGIFIVFDTTKIDHFGSLDRSEHCDGFTVNIFDFPIDSNFFSCFSDCSLSKEFIIFNFSSWKCPKIWPNRCFVWALYEKYMRSMLTDKICCCRYKRTRHMRIIFMKSVFLIGCLRTIRGLYLQYPP